MMSITKLQTMIWTNVRQYPTRLNQPAVNTFEHDNAYTLELALPGWKKSDVSLEVDGELLLVNGKRDVENDIEYRRREFGLNNFEKSFHLPDTVDVEGIGAAMEAGVLTITLPKVAEAQPVKKLIEVA